MSIANGTRYISIANGTRYISITSGTGVSIRGKGCIHTY